ncbi:MAG: topoisomerase DNA-binding C4 zinc finger domain-containing protein [Pseudomonadota bacterium]
MSKIDASLFEKRSATAISYGDCPKCNASLHLKFKGKTAFVGCSNYPACDYAENLHQDEIKTLKVMDDSKCPLCSSPLAVKNGRFGMFIGCTSFPSCHFIQQQRTSSDTDEQDTVLCPKCNVGELKKRQNKYGKYFYACDNYPKCKFLTNHKPIQKTCEACGYTMLIELDEGNQLICGNKKCAMPIENPDADV